MQWETSISDVHNGKEVIRGQHLHDLITHQSFVEAIFLILKGELPTPAEAHVLNAMLVAGIDHGIGTASAMTARIVASSKNDLHTAIAAGILSMGERHGGAVEGAAEFFRDHAGEIDIDGLIALLREKKVRIPGYGHAVLSTDDRSAVLLSIAKEQKLYGKYCAFAEAVHDALNRQSSKKLPLNIDGAMAAILLDMGFDPATARGIFVIARVPGLVAHVIEERNSDTGLRRLNEGESTYTGKL